MTGRLPASTLWQSGCTRNRFRDRLPKQSSRQLSADSGCPALHPDDENHQKLDKAFYSFPGDTPSSYVLMNTTEAIITDHATRTSNGILRAVDAGHRIL